MSKILLIDANSIGYAAQQATKLTNAGMETQAIFGFLKSMKILRERFTAYTPMVLWDGRAEWRYKLYPGYKANRNSDPKKVAMKESYAKQKPHLELALRHLGIRQLTAHNMEADDLAGHFVGKLSADPANKIGLITGDEDWQQLIRQNVWWRDMRDDSKYVDHKNFYDKTGCKTPFAFLESKILQGDNSDTITGVGGIGEKGAPEFIAQFGSVRNFWQQCDSGLYVPKLKAEKSLWKGDSPHTKEEWIGQQVTTTAVRTPEEEAKLKKKWADAWPGQGKSIYKRNFQLMQLLRVDAPKKEDIKLDTGKFDKEAFAKICEEMSFVSILRNLDEFTNHFIQK